MASFTSGWVIIKNLNRPAEAITDISRNLAHVGLAAEHLTTIDSSRHTDAQRASVSKCCMVPSAVAAWARVEGADEGALRPAVACGTGHRLDDNAESRYRR